MGLNKEEWHAKRTKEIVDYVLQNGKKISETQVYWNTYPIVTKDICVLGVMVKGKKTYKLSFGDMIDGKFKELKSPDELERKYLEEILIDIKRADGLTVADRKVGGRKFVKKTTTSKKK